MKIGNTGTKLIIFIDIANKNCTLAGHLRVYNFPVPGAGVEPAQPCGHWCLRPARLPIPPSGPAERCKGMQILRLDKKIVGGPAEFLQRFERFLDDLLQSQRRIFLEKRRENLLDIGFGETQKDEGREGFFADCRLL